MEWMDGWMDGAGISRYRLSMTGAFTPVPFADMILRAIRD